MKKEMTITEFARSGGQATVKKYGNEHMRKISKLAVKARLKRAKNKDIPDLSPANEI